MALAMERVTAMAREAKARCNGFMAEYYKLKSFLTCNSNEAIDWGAGSTPSYITEDADGNITGLPYTRQEVSNAIGSLDAIRALAEANSSAHIGNLNQLADPVPIR